MALRLTTLLALLASAAAWAQPLGETRVVDRPTLHVVAVGVDDYADDVGSSDRRIFDLAGPVADATALVRAFDGAGGEFFGRVERHLLTDAAATPGGVRRAIERVAAASGVHDTVVFYFGGHSYFGGRSYFDAPAGEEGGLVLSGPGAPVLSVETLGLWLSQVPAQRLFAAIDGQGSPEAGRMLQAAILPSVSGPSARSVTLVVPEGVVWETRIGGETRGTVSYALELALLGLADADGDGVVSAHEVTPAFFDDRFRSFDVPDQSVAVTSVGPDFPLGRSGVLGADGAFRFEAPALAAVPARDLVDAAFATRPPTGPELSLALVRTLRQMADQAPPASARRDSTVLALDHRFGEVRSMPGRWTSRDSSGWDEDHWQGYLDALLADAAACARCEGSRPAAMRILSEAYRATAELAPWDALAPPLAEAAAPLRSGTAAGVDPPLPPAETEPPRIALQPVVGDTAVAVVGRVEGSRPALSVTVDGRPVELTPSGRFAATLGLGAGATTYTVRATDAGGAVVERAVTVERTAYRGQRTDEEAPAEPPLPPRRDLAVFFATDAYDDPRLAPLANPIADAVAIARELHDRHGFDTLVVRNPTKAEIERTLYAYHDLVFGDDEDSQLFVFFAGHGQYVERHGAGQGYIQTTDAVAGDRVTYLPMRDVAARLDGMTNFDRILLVLDVCYGGEVFAASRDGGGLYDAADRDEVLRAVAGTRSRLALTSGDRERVADGLPGQHSPFAARVLEALRTGAGDDRLLFFDELAAEVRQVRGQTPQAGTFGVHGDGLTFVFVEDDD